jgi:hypothetical protein
MPLVQHRQTALKSLGSEEEEEEEEAVVAPKERHPVLRHRPAVPAVDYVSASDAASEEGQRRRAAGQKKQQQKKPPHRGPSALMPQSWLQ